MKPTRYRLLLAALPLLLGADQIAGRGSSLQVNRLPSCADGEYLIYQGGVLVCGEVSAGSVQFPDCAGQLLTVRKNGDVSSFTCTPLGTGTLPAADAARLAEAQRRYQALDQVIRSWSAPELLYVGVTTVKTTGRIARSGSATGLPAANDLCADQYPGARMCTFQDMHDSVATGTITEATRIPSAWVYLPAGNSLAAGAAPDGLGDTCSGHTSDAAAGAGVAVEWTILPTGGVGFLFHGGTKATCDRALPIACCGS